MRTVCCLAPFALPPTQSHNIHRTSELCSLGGWKGWPASAVGTGTPAGRKSGKKGQLSTSSDCRTSGSSGVR
eukprot:1577244-Pyramimonas_sp.AAC.1